MKTTHRSMKAILTYILGTVEPFSWKLTREMLKRIPVQTTKQKKSQFSNRKCCMWRLFTFGWSYPLCLWMVWNFKKARQLIRIRRITEETQHPKKWAHYSLCKNICFLPHIHFSPACVSLQGIYPHFEATTLFRCFSPKLNLGVLTENYSTFSESLHMIALFCHDTMRR